MLRFWIDLTLRYADGTVWHASPYAQCETPPDNIMLIADK